MLFQEHIMSPMIRGHITVNQTDGSQSKLDGSKDSTVSFNTPDGGDRRKYNLKLNGVKNVTTNETQRARNFIVDLVSPHALVNNSTPNYQKSFKNQQISSVIHSILKDGLGLDIPVNIGDTKGLHGSDYQPVILTQKSPLRHIDDLRRMAVSSKNFDGFLAFAAIGKSLGEEFNFKSIHDILQGDVATTISNFTKFEMNSNLAQSMMNNVIEMWLPQQSDALNKGSSFSSGATSYDIHKAVVDIPNLVMGAARQILGSATSLNPGQVSGFTNEAFNGLIGTANMILEDSRRPSTNKALTGPYTEALMADLKQNFLTIKIPGNSNLKIGDIINFDYRENTENFMNSDTKFSGKNLIAGISHYIGPLSDSPRYVTYLDLVNVQTKNGSIS